MWRLPRRSPFRHPGGKTWFVPTFRRWLASPPVNPRIPVEPFAGGGMISLTALFEGLTERVVMVELDDDVAAMWEAVVNGDAKDHGGVFTGQGCGLFHRFAVHRRRQAGGSSP